MAEFARANNFSNTSRPWILKKNPPKTFYVYLSAKFPSICTRGSRHKITYLLTTVVTGPYCPHVLSLSKTRLQIVDNWLSKATKTETK